MPPYSAGSTPIVFILFLCLSPNTSLGPYTHLFLSILVASEPLLHSPSVCPLVPGSGDQAPEPMSLWLALPISPLPTISPLPPPSRYSLSIFREQLMSSPPPGSSPDFLGWGQAFWKPLLPQTQEVGSVQRPAWPRTIHRDSQQVLTTQGGYHAALSSLWVHYFQHQFPCLHNNGTRAILPT